MIPDHCFMPKQNARSIMGQVSKFFHVFLTERCVLITNLRLARAGPNRCLAISRHQGQPRESFSGMSPVISFHQTINADMSIFLGG